VNKVLKYILIGVGSLAALVIILTFIVFMILPSPAQIGKAISADKKSSNVKTDDPKIKANAEVSPPHKNDSSKNDLSPDKGEPAKPKRSVEESFTMLDKMADPQKPMVTFCDSLPNVNPAQLGSEDFDARWTKSIYADDPSQKDPVIESFAPPLKFVLQQPHMQDVLGAVKDAIKEGNTTPDTLAAKVGFYQSLWGAYQEMLANQHHTEELMDRTYHLYMMTKAVAKNRGLLQNEAMLNYCREIEAAINNNTPASIEEERASFNDFMKASGVDPKSIGYNENYKTHLKVTYNKTQLTFSGGWYDDFLRPLGNEAKQK
jgi:hypothetical protein